MLYFYNNWLECCFGGKKILFYLFSILLQWYFEGKNIMLYLFNKRLQWYVQGKIIMYYLYIYFCIYQKITHTGIGHFHLFKAPQ